MPRARLIAAASKRSVKPFAQLSRPRGILRSTARIALLMLSFFFFSQSAPMRLEAASAASAPKSGPSLLVSPAGSSPLRTLDNGGITYFCLADLAPILKGSIAADEPGAIFTYRQGERVIHFSIEAPLATVDETVVDLLAPPVVADGGPYLPLEFVLKHLLDPAGFAADWSRSERTLRIRPAGGSDVSVAVSVVHSGEATKCVFTFDSAVKYQLEKKIDGAVLQINARGIAPPFAEQDFSDPIVSRVSFRGHSAALAYKRGSFATEVYSLSNPFRIVVEVQPVAREIGGIRIGKTPAPVTPPPLQKTRMTTIVLDPGHGGVEVGALGKGGSQEKDLTLELAKSLKGVLETSYGYKVLLTRDRDLQVPLEDRPAYANHNQADLFLSIHLNASPAKKPRGSETYYLSLSATDEAAKKLADSENRTDGGGGPKPTGRQDLDFLLWDLVQNEHVKESALLAEDIQNQLNTLLGLSNRGIKQAPFRVLVGAAMPAVLIEVAFITNPEEEKSLLSAEFRHRVADAIATGVETYRSRYEPRMGSTLSAAPSGGASQPGRNP